MSRLLVAVAALLAVAPAYAVNPVGTWSGRFVFKGSVAPPNATLAQRQEIARRVAMVAKGRLVLTLKADKSYVIKAIQLPMFGKSVQTGTWSLSGTTVSLKDPSESKPRNFVLDPKGKRMTMTIPGGSTQVVFVR